MSGRVSTGRTAQLAAIALVVCFSGTAMPESLVLPQPDAAQLLREIDSLSVVGSVLYVAAHPDDENTRLLNWLVGDKKVRAAYLSLTRGEGGQNLVGSEQAPLLGLIRTQELLAARRIDGAQQFFGDERDFGYSKTAEETLSIWKKPDALGDVVWAIRRFRPDVIITRFSPDNRETHGHHTASAMLAVEAFRLAADPKAYPEQLQWVAPWQATRIVYNEAFFGTDKPGGHPGFVELEVGGYDPLLGASFGEIAARSRSMHRSQGFGVAPRREPTSEYFRVLAGQPMQQGFFDGIDLTWARVAGTEKLREALKKARDVFKPERPDAAVPALLEAAAALEAIPANAWKAEKATDLNHAIAACAGLFIDATASEYSVVPGTTAKISVTALNRSAEAWKLHSFRVLDKETVIDRPLQNAVPLNLEETVSLPSPTPYSAPFWLRNEPSAGRWTVNDPAVRGLPEAPAPVHVQFVIDTGARRIELTRPVVYAWTDPAFGERRRTLEVLPAATLNSRDALLMFPDESAKELRVTVHATRGAVAGNVSPEAPKGFQIEPGSQSFSLAEANAEQELVFKVRPPAALPHESDAISGQVRFRGSVHGSNEPVTWQSVARIEYPHIPIQTIAAPAEVKVVRLQMKRAIAKIGYVPGAGDEVPAALRQVGYDVTLLSEEALQQPLGAFQAIVVGVRAFNVNSRLATQHRQLMDYVSNGGTLLVQYNTNNRISRVAGDIGPWPFSISQLRVTDETAAVQRLVADHAAFSAPNRIDERDFSGWVQERGLYFADKWDEHYKALLSMHDPGEPGREGALLVGRYGKGTFIYTGLAFFRQLPAGVPGAYRLFANLLTHAS